jgi:RNA polymerase sigma-70 factor (sigma-E family)
MATVPRQDADQALQHLYAAHYAGLVRLAALLVRNSGEAEEVVQDAFVAMHGRWSRLREPAKAVGYLRRTVVNNARSSLRRHAVADKHRESLVDVAASAEHGALAAESRSVIIAALHQLPQRQREVLVLRYYGDLSEADIAATLRISRGAVKSHASRGVAALRSRLEDQL